VVVVEVVVVVVAGVVEVVVMVVTGLVEVVDVVVAGLVVAGLVVAGVVEVVVVVVAGTDSHSPSTYTRIPAASALQLFPYVDPSDPQTGEYSSVQNVGSGSVSVSEHVSIGLALHSDATPSENCPQQASAVAWNKREE
jgi:hypothetical protein